MLARVGAFSLAAVATAAAQGFEGTFTTKTISLRAETVEERLGENRDRAFEWSVDQLLQFGAGVDSTVMWIKGSRFRGQAMDMPGAAGAYLLINTATRVIQTVIPAQRSYYETSLANVSLEPDEEEDEPEPTVEPLGRTQMIAGLRCTGYRVTQEGEVSLVWTTSDATYRQVFESQLRAWDMGDRKEAKALGLLRKLGFPVMTQALEEDGGYRVELITLTRASQPDSLFIIPAGFRKMTVPGQ